MPMNTTIEYEVTGKYALFSEVATRIGGEKSSYQVPTYQALRGITESIYWKPTIEWYIDEVRIVNRIQTEGKGIRPIKMSGGNDLSYYTYLKDVRYQVRAHFEWNDNRGDLAQDRNPAKHLDIAKRALARGGRRDIFLGTRECQGYVEPCVFGDGEGFYDDYGELDLGYMFFCFRYPDNRGDDRFTRKFWRVKMRDGVITFPRPDDENLDEFLVSDKKTTPRFTLGRNLKSVEEES